jgi:hypothetical protein
LHSSHEISLENIEAIDIQPNAADAREESGWRNATDGRRNKRTVNRHSLCRVLNTAGGA